MKALTAILSTINNPSYRRNSAPSFCHLALDTRAGLSVCFHIVLVLGFLISYMKSLLQIASLLSADTRPRKSVLHLYTNKLNVNSVAPDWLLRATPPYPPGWSESSGRFKCNRTFEMLPICRIKELFNIHYLLSVFYVFTYTFNQCNYDFKENENGKHPLGHKAKTV